MNRKLPLFLCLSLCLLSSSAMAKRVITKDPVLDSDKPDAETKRVKLPEIPEAPGKGNFIFHDTPTFRFTVGTTGSCLLQLKDDSGELHPKGKFELGGSIATGWAKPIDWDRYKNREITRGITRNMIEFSEVKPTNKPSGKIFIRAKLMDNVDYHRVFNFSGNKVEVWSGFKCPNRDYPSQAGISTEFPATKAFAPQIPLDERKASMENWWLKFDTDETKKKEWKFYENAKLPTRAKEMQVFGPWGPKRKLSIEAKGETLSPSMYAGNCPHQGFKLGIARIGNNTTSSSGYVGYVIIVD